MSHFEYFGKCLKPLVSMRSREKKQKQEKEQGLHLRHRDSCSSMECVNLWRSLRKMTSHWGDRHWYDENTEDKRRDGGEEVVPSTDRYSRKSKEDKTSSEHERWKQSVYASSSPEGKGDSVASVVGEEADKRTENSDEC